jgi:hypothetical protein
VYYTGFNVNADKDPFCRQFNCIFSLPVPFISYPTYPQFSPVGIRLVIFAQHLYCCMAVEESVIL